MVPSPFGELLIHWSRIMLRAVMPDNHSQFVQDGVEPNTATYPAAGFFTGIRSSVILHQPCSRVYDSLAADLHLLFGSIEVSLT